MTEQTEAQDRLRRQRNGWKKEAERYSQNTDHWRERVEKAEATIDRVKALADEFAQSHATVSMSVVAKRLRKALQGDSSEPNSQ